MPTSASAATGNPADHRVTASRPQRIVGVRGAPQLNMSGSSGNSGQNQRPVTRPPLMWNNRPAAANAGPPVDQDADDEPDLECDEAHRHHRHKPTRRKGQEIPLLLESQADHDVVK